MDLQSGAARVILTTSMHDYFGRSSHLKILDRRQIQYDAKIDENEVGIVKKIFLW